MHSDENRNLIKGFFQRNAYIIVQFSVTVKIIDVYAQFMMAENKSGQRK